LLTTVAYSGATVRPFRWFDCEFCDNFCAVFVSFVSQLNRKNRVPKAPNCPYIFAC